MSYIHGLHVALSILLVVTPTSSCQKKKKKLLWCESHIGEWKTLSNKVSAMSDDVTSVQIVYMLQCIKHYLSLAFSIFSFWESLFWKVEKKLTLKPPNENQRFIKKNRLALIRDMCDLSSQLYIRTRHERRRKQSEKLTSFLLNCHIFVYALWADIAFEIFTFRHSKLSFTKKKMISPYFVLCTALNTGFRKELIHKDDGGPTTWWDIF